MSIADITMVGKTVLLNAFEDLAEAEGFLTYYHELTPATGLVQELARDSQVALARLKLTAKVTGPEGIELSVDIKRADEATITSDLTELFLQLGQAEAPVEYAAVIGDAQWATLVPAWAKHAFQPPPSNVAFEQYAACG